MAVVQLASSTDVVAVMGRTLTSAESARVEAILDKASELFRRESGQKWIPGSETVRVRVTDGYVLLPQRVPTVISVITSDDLRVTYSSSNLLGQKLFLTTAIGGNPIKVAYSGDLLRVTYTFSGAVPDLVRLAVAEIAKKVLLIPAGAQGGSSQHTETIGAYTVSDSYATWAQGGQTMLSPSDMELARSYRVKSRAAIVLEP